MTDTGEEITKALHVDTMFSFMGGRITINESIVTMWIVMAVMIVWMIIARSRLSVDNPKRGQIALEMFFKKLYNFMLRMTGENGKQYIPYIIMLFIFISVSNMFPIFGFKPPTKDLNMTVALAVITIVLVEYAGIRHRGVKGWAKAFAKPAAMATPFNILDIIIRPFSLCMRLMGNMLGGFAIMKLIETAVPMVVPAFASLYFDIFDGLLQAFVFCFLTAIYIGEAVEDNEE